jgi:hypothetical protein
MQKKTLNPGEHPILEVTFSACIEPQCTPGFPDFAHPSQNMIAIVNRIIIPGKIVNMKLRND